MQRMGKCIMHFRVVGLACQQRRASFFSLAVLFIFLMSRNKRAISFLDKTQNINHNNSR